MLPESTRGMTGYSLRKAVNIWALPQKTFKIQKKEEKQKKNVLTVSIKVFRQQSQKHSGLVALESGRAAMTHVCMTTGFHRCCASQTHLLANRIFGSRSFISYLMKNKLCQESISTNCTRKLLVVQVQVQIPEAKITRVIPLQPQAHNDTSFSWVSQIPNLCADAQTLAEQILQEHLSNPKSEAIKKVFLNCQVLQTHVKSMVKRWSDCILHSLCKAGQKEGFQLV